jgi:uncharacterized protein YbjT (DUF2867 family)
MAQQSILVLGATGNLGSLIVKELLSLKVDTHVVIRPASGDRLQALSAQGITVHIVDMGDTTAMQKALSGRSCVVSALAGLGEVIEDLQTLWLHAAVAVGVPRFIPSDYCTDFRDLVLGNNQ